MQGDADSPAMAAERLVGGVVDHFLDDVQRAIGARVHSRPMAYGLKALENGNRFCGVGHGAEVSGGTTGRRVARMRCSWRDYGTLSVGASSDPVRAVSGTAAVAAAGKAPRTPPRPRHAARWLCSPRRTASRGANPAATRGVCFTAGTVPQNPLRGHPSAAVSPTGALCLAEATWRSVFRALPPGSCSRCRASPSGVPRAA